MAIYLGLETSCDETAVALVEDGRRLLSSQIISQIEIHKEFGGVVPEVAARHHVGAINSMIAACLEEAKIKPSEISAIACTQGPGLIGTLLVGLAAAKALAWSWDLPLLAVDHLFAHVCANYIESDLNPPFMALLVSGGHTQMIYFKSASQYEVLGQSVDDACGEAYDKVARLLKLGYPGGPKIDKLARSGDSKRFAFPEGVVQGYNFSFSGLKTSVLRTVQKNTESLDSEEFVRDISAGFQKAVVDVLVKKTLKAQLQYQAPSIVLAGGVACNSLLRETFEKLSPVPVYFPAAHLCTDNAAMVAAAAFYCGKVSELSVGAYSRHF